MAYVRGAKAGTARSKAGTFEIVEVLVVGVATRGGLKQASPVVQDRGAPGMRRAVAQVSVGRVICGRR